MKTPALFFVSALLSVASLCGQTKPPAKSALDKSVLEPYVRHLFVWPAANIQVQIADPKPSTQLPGFLEVKVKASAGNQSQEETFLISKDGKKILKAMVFDIDKNPFSDDLAKLKTEGQPSFGPDKAPVVIVLFSDFQCAFCKEEAKMLRQNIPSAYPTQVRVYFKDFPLEQIHPWAKPASIAAHCIFRQKPAAFWDFHDWIYDHQSEITAENLKSKVLEFAKGKGLDTAKLEQCMDSRATEADVDRNVFEAKELQVSSTPTVFVNGRRLVGQMGWPQLRQVIDYELEYQKTAHNAGEDCCSVKLPSVLGN